MVSGDALVRFDKRAQAFTAVPGITLGHVPQYGLQAGGQSYLWAISADTLVRIDPTEGEVVEFAASSGKVGPTNEVGTR